MLGKLYKHEFVGLYRILFPIYAFLICMAGGLRLLLLVNSEAVLLKIVLNITITLTIFLAVGLMFASFVLIIVNFYKSLLSKQGYLTFSLPFKASTHIICKLVCAVVSMITSIIAELLALLIILGDFSFFDNFFEIMKTMITQGKEIFGLTKLILLIAEVLIVALVTLCSSILMFFASMAIGQQFKNKILGAIVSYFAIYTAVQIILLLVTAVLSSLASDIFVPNTAGEIFFVWQNIMLFVFFVALVEAVGYFLLTNYFLSKKLNLE